MQEVRSQSHICTGTRSTSSPQLVWTFQVLSRAQGAGCAQRRGQGEGALTSFQCILCGCTGAVKIALQPKPPTARTHIVSSTTRATTRNYLRLYCVAECCTMMQQVKTDKVAIHNNLATCYSKQRNWCAISLQRARCNAAHSCCIHQVRGDRAVHQGA